MLAPNVHSALAAILPPSSLLVTPEETKPYECDGLTLYRTLPAAVALPENEAQVIAILRRCHEARVPVVARGAGTSLSGGALPDGERRRAVAGEIQAHPVDRPADAHCRGPARRAQPVDLGRGRRVRPLLRARSVVADRLLDRRQRRRECRWRALPEVRPHRAQRAARARRAHHRRDRRVRRRLAGRTGLRPAGARSPEAKACSPSSPRSPSSCCPSRSSRRSRSRRSRTSSRRARRWATSSPRASSRRDSR